jgi:hypothetical protein
MTKNQILSRLRAKGHITEEEYHLLKEERPHGEWELSSIQVVGENWYKCSICGRKIRTSTYHLKEYPFCHCGADMREAQEMNKE